MVFLFFLFFAIETSCPIGAGDDAIFASDTSSEILHNDTVFPAISCFDRTDGYAWSMVTMHARHRDEFCIHPRIFTGGHGDHLIPENISSQSLLIR
jgi:hypothetical protein